MTYKEWERRLLKNLKSLPKNERQSLADYYREMYGDKQDLGLTDEEILQEFGTPEACAEKILSEEREASPTLKQKPTERTGGISVASIVGIAFASLILILPLACIAIALIAAFGSVTLGGAIVSLAGIVYTVVSPFSAINGVGGGAITAHIGIGLAMCGVGILLFIGFLLLTIYTTIGVKKAFVFLYGRRKRQ